MYLSMILIAKLGTWRSTARVHVRAKNNYREREICKLRMYCDSQDEMITRHIVGINTSTSDGVAC